MVLNQKENLPGVRRGFNVVLTDPVGVLLRIVWNSS